tara:strand:+ start:21641 stop:22237 length:597 start_codon:yes stop_codon:yes gene_type:complete
MIYSTEELNKAFYPTYTNSEGCEVKDTTRLTQIKRTSINFLFAYEKMPLGEDVGLLEPFQNSDDVLNEFRGILIKPFLCSYLTAKHTLDFSLELGLMLINGLTPSGKLGESLVNIFVEACYIIGYALNTVVTTATVIPIFALRCVTTLLSEAIRFFTPSENYNAIYENYNNNVIFPSPSAPPLAHAVPIENPDATFGL